MTITATLVVLVILFIALVVLGIQFGRGKWLGLVLQQKHPSNKPSNEKRDARLRRREEQARRSVGAQLAYVMFAAAFAAFLQIISEILLNLGVASISMAFFFISLICYVVVIILLVRTIRKIQGQ